MKGYKGQSLNMSYRDFAKILKANGFTVDRQSGDHIIWVREGKHISINPHPNMMVMRRLIKENNLKV